MQCPEEEANVFSIASFHWVTGLMRKGYNKPLTMDDLWELRNDDQSKKVSLSFEEAWEKELKKKTPSLIRALAAAFGGPFYIAGIWKMVNDILGFLQPLLLRQMLLFVMSYKTESPQSLTGMKIRVALITAIYQKSLRLSNTARQEFTVGEIVNHMSVDTQRIENVVNYLHGLWSSVFQITVTLYLLYATLGWAVFVGLGVMLLMIPLNAKLSLVMQRYQKRQMEFKDKRIKLMNEILNGIRVIKLYAWEGTFLQKVLSIRNDYELDMMKRMGYVAAGQMFTWNSTPFLVSMVNFAVYTGVMKKPLTTDVLFAAIALLNVLQSPLVMLPWVISSCIEAKVAIERVYKFLLCTEIDPNAVIVESRRPQSTSGQDASEKYSLLVTDASYSWYKNSQPVISGINLALKKDCLLSVIGRVGSGKSSLIAALCGDLERVSGE
ncbi:hypothetical protein BGX27_008133, partial [Mortierella sp. AM989]